MHKFLGFSLKQKASPSSPSASSVLSDNLLLCTKLRVHFFFLVLINPFIQGAYSSAVFTLLNNCQFIVWPGINSSDAGGGSFPISGFALQTGESKTVKAPSSWVGSIWGRTDCSESPDGFFACTTGGCSTRRLECARGSATTAVTLAEFTLYGSAGKDFYDVSVVDGFNLPISVVPLGVSGAGCTSTRCVFDLNGTCPPKLRVTSGGEIIACQSPCQAFGTEEYCCTGASPCGPTEYSQVFKNACPNAYSYALDDLNTTFTCAGGADYNITFCPSSDMSRLPTSRGSPTPPPSSQGSPPPSPSSQGSPPPSPSSQDSPSPPPSSKGMKKPVRIIVIVVSTLVLLIFGNCIDHYAKN